MFVHDRQLYLDALKVMGRACCVYAGDWPENCCDCKYGVESGKWPGGHELGNGCPELRTLHTLVTALSDDEFDTLLASQSRTNLLKHLQQQNKPGPYSKGIWIAAQDDSLHVLEHEGDYEDDDLLIHIVADARGPQIRVVKNESI